MASTPEVAVEVRLVAVFEAAQPSNNPKETEAAFTSLSYVRDRKGTEAPLWKPIAHSKPLTNKLEEKARGFFADCVRPMTLGFSFTQESVVWQHKSPGWAGRGLRQALTEQGHDRTFPFVLSAVDGWVFPGGLVHLVLTLKPWLRMSPEIAGAAAELLVRLGSEAGKFSRKFRGDRELNSAVQRLHANEHSALFASLCGGEVKTEDLVRSMVPVAFERRGGLRPVVLLRTPREAPHEPLSRAEQEQLVRMSMGLGGSAAVSGGLMGDVLNDALYDDGRANMTFAVTPGGAGCWARARAEDRFLREGNFDRIWKYNYLPLFLLALAQQRSLRQIEQRLATALLQGRPTEGPDDEHPFLRNAKDLRPSKEPFHNNFFQAARTAFDIDTSLAQILEHRDKAASRPPRVRSTAPRDHGTAYLEPVIASTGRWFEAGDPLEAYAAGALPHSLERSLDAESLDRIGAKLKSEVGIRRSKSYRPVESSDLASNLHVHRYLVQTWFPWMPDSWWGSWESTWSLHRALTTVIGGHANQATGGQYPLSVAGAYVVLCHAVWHKIGNQRGIDVLDGYLRRDWADVSPEREPLFARQDEETAYSALVFLERFLIDILKPENQEHFPTNAESVDLGTGFELRVTLVRGFDSPSLGHKLDKLVSDLIRGARPPQLGPTSAALIHLHLAQLPCLNGAGPAGNIALRGRRLTLIAGES